MNRETGFALAAVTMLTACSETDRDVGARQPVAAEEAADEQRSEADAGPTSDGGASDASAADAATYCRDVALSRRLCGGEGECPPKVLEERTCSQVSAAAVSCIVEIATGDIYTTPSGDPLENIVGRLRQCNEAEEQRLIDSLD